jgi:hypothetical protein
MTSSILSDVAATISLFVGGLGGLGGLIFTGLGGLGGLAKLINFCFFRLRTHSVQMPPSSLRASNHRYLLHLIHLPPCAVVFLA